MALEKARDAIISGYFKPGDRLVERDLCAQLGVSRTVVREVLRHLESEGLVSNPQSKGPMVALLDIDEARQIYEIRAALEGMAARLCAERGDPAIVTGLSDALDAIKDSYARQDMADVLRETTRFYETLFTRIDRQVAWGVVRQMTVRINHLRSMTIKTDGRATEDQPRCNGLSRRSATATDPLPNKPQLIMCSVPPLLPSRCLRSRPDPPLRSNRYIP